MQTLKNLCMNRLRQELKWMVISKGKQAICDQFNRQLYNEFEFQSKRRMVRNMREKNQPSTQKVDMRHCFELYGLERGSNRQTMKYCLSVSSMEQACSGIDHAIYHATMQQNGNGKCVINNGNIKTVEANVARSSRCIPSTFDLQTTTRCNQVNWGCVSS